MPYSVVKRNQGSTAHLSAHGLKCKLSQYSRGEQPIGFHATVKSSLPVSLIGCGLVKYCDHSWLRSLQQAHALPALSGNGALKSMTSHRSSVPLSQLYGCPPPRHPQVLHPECCSYNEDVGPHFPSSGSKLRSRKRTDIILWKQALVLEEDRHRVSYLHSPGRSASIFATVSTFLVWSPGILGSSCSPPLPLLRSLPTGPG